MNIRIRKETENDIDKISEITIAAFKDHPVGDQTEHFIIKALRASGELELSLVAELNGEIVGHIAFSPISTTDKTKDWYGLGPISVHPEHQRKSIGSALIKEGLTQLKNKNAQGCALVGEPEYYRRFGFINYPAFIYEGIPQEFFLILPFDENLPTGKAIFNKAFLAKS